MEPTMNAENQMPPAAPTKKTSYGGIAAIVLILALILVGAFYFWGERIATDGTLTPEEQQMVEALEAQGDSSDPSAIEADLEAQTADDFSEDFDTAFAELDAAFEAQ